MKRKLTAIVVVIVIAVSAISAIAAYWLVTKPDANAHSPIDIWSDAGFTKENGVISGTGSAPDPYIIEGWKIKAPNNGGGISVKATRAHFVIRNTTITGNFNSYGVGVFDAWNWIIEGCDITRHFTGIHVFNSAFCAIINNSLLEGGAIELIQSRDCTISQNVMSNVTHWPGVICALTISECRNTTVTSNEFINCGISINTDVRDSESITVTPDNLVNGRPVIYRAGEENITLSDTELGQLMFVNCTNVKMSHLILSGGAQGIAIMNVTNCQITACEIGEVASAGFSASGSRNFTVEDCVFTSRVWIFSCSQFILGNNTSTNPGGFWGNAWDLVDSDNFTASGNQLSDSTKAVEMNGCENATVCENNISDNDEGIRFFACDHLIVYHNNFFENNVSIYAELSSSLELDNGYPSGGNFWSDYVGVDAYQGADQLTLGADGIGDTSYEVTGAIEDRYPLMEPYTS